MLLSPAGADPLLKQFEEFGIMRNVVELEAYGMTVVPPEVLNWAPGFAERLKVRPIPLEFPLSWPRSWADFSPC